MKKVVVIFLFVTFILSCNRKESEIQEIGIDNQSFYHNYRKNCRAINICIQIPNTKTSLVAKSFNNKDSIDMIFSFISETSIDTTNTCSFVEWGDIYFYNDDKTNDYYLDLYFSIDRECRLLQNSLNKNSKKFKLNHEGRVYLNNLIEQYYFPYRYRSK